MGSSPALTRSMASAVSRRRAGLFEEILEISLAGDEMQELIADKETWLRDRMERFRRPVSQEEQQLRDGRWLRHDDRRTPDGGAIGMRIDITALKQREEATFIEDFPLLVDRHGYPEKAHFTFCYSPIRDEAGVVRGMIDTVIETTATVEARRQASLLNGELEHRIKNTLAVVAAIVSQTLRTSENSSAARSILLERIQAMAQAQSLLTRASATEATVVDVVLQAITPFRTSEERFHISGPPIMLSSKQALSLSLALHELATNAVKYGSLSNETGGVRIAWSGGRPDTDDAFILRWIEEGGPPVLAPARTGFGSRIIQTVMPHDFGGEATLSYDPPGVRFELRTCMRKIGGSLAPPDQSAHPLPEE